MKIATRFVHIWLATVRYNCRRMTKGSLPTPSIHWCTAFAVAIAIILLTAAPGAAPRATTQQQPQISARAMAQIQALIDDKNARTEVQKRIDSQLIYKSRMARGVAVARGVSTLEVQTMEAADGRELIDVTAHNASSLVPAVTALGATVVFADDRMLRLQASLDALEAIAAIQNVVSVHPAVLPETHLIANRLRGRTAVPKLFWTARGTLGASAVVDVTSEGDVTHRANLARTNSRVTGAGIKIGVLSSGVEGLEESKAAGALGNVTVLSGQAGQGNEGTAMLEIVHDLAPGAELYFATGFPSVTQFATNIQALRAAGCNIIVDDLLYPDESPFQDGQAAGVVSSHNSGIVIQAVKDVVASGALYFSSSANSNNLDLGTSGTWEGDFVDSGSFYNGKMHRFGFVGGVPYPFNVISQSGNNLKLFWSDPLGQSTNDYDLYLIDSTGNTVKGSSTNEQSVAHPADPYESISNANAPGDLLVVSLFNGNPRFLHVETGRGKFQLNTSGSTYGHANTTAANSFGVASTPVTTKSPNCTTGTNGPYPGVFTAANVTDCFSSDGPRHIFFTNNGTALTANNFLASGGQILVKPDLTAADGNQVSGAGYIEGNPLNGVKTPFFGTSAAAPHAAAIAALVWSKNPAQTPTQVRAALLASAIDIMGAGTDRTSGVGIIMADTAVAAAALFTDDPLQAGITPTKAIHITELRTMINAVRTRNGASAFSFTDPTLTTSIGIKAVHITELRTALQGAYASLGLTPPTVFTTITAGTTRITAAMLTEIRNYLRPIY